MLTLGIVLIAHCIFDFYLQSTGMAVQKETDNKGGFGSLCDKGLA